MYFIWGIILTSATLKVWVSQILIAFFPKFAQKINIIRHESDVDQTYFIDMQASAVWDSITLWTLPVSGVLLILDNPLWTYFGLIGGSMLIYFARRNIAINLKLYCNGINIGKSKKLKVNLLILTVWELIGLITLLMAFLTLNSQHFYLM